MNVSQDVVGGAVLQAEFDRGTQTRVGGLFESDCLPRGGSESELVPHSSPRKPVRVFGN